MFAKGMTSALLKNCNLDVGILKLNIYDKNWDNSWFS